MLRLLIVAQDAGQEAEMVGRASDALDWLGSDAEVLVTARTAGVAAVTRLDGGLFTRPLPDQLLVVGRDASCSPRALTLLIEALDVDPDLGAVMRCVGSRDDVHSALEYGGAFRGGPMCQAGGFDGARPFTERLVEVGFASTHLAATVGRPRHLRSLVAIPA